jgi:predicted transcriptional regulator
MRVSTVKVLDDKYTEFVEALQGLGELQNIKRLLAYLSEPYGQIDDEGSELRAIGAVASMRTLWENGWIEVFEAKRQSKGVQRRRYTLRINLEKICCYFKQEQATGTVLSGGQEARALS